VDVRHPGARRLLGCLLVSAGVLATPACGAAEDSADPLHFDEMTFIGTVTEHDPYDIHQLTVDQADVSLNLIGPVDGGCFTVEPSLREQARAAKEALLPVGARVLVVRADDSGDWAFLHLLPAGSDTPEPARPAASANEQLVSGGYWEPSGYELADDDSDTQAAFGVRSAEVLSPVQAEYAPLIVAAGNATKAARTTGYVTCLAEAEKQEAELDAAREEARRQAEDYDRRRRQSGGGGSGYCRDGDGDGICYED